MLLLSFSSHELHAVYHHLRDAAFSGFAAEFFVVVAVPAPECLHFVFGVRDIGGDIRAAPESFQFNGCNGPSRFPFSHTEKSHC